MAKHSKTTGFTIVELLISLVLLAMLMTAMAAACHAWFMSYGANQRISAITQSARSIINKMSREVRTAQAVTSTSTRLDITPPVQPGGPDLVTYEFDQGNLYYRQRVAGQTTSYVLLGSEDEVNVSSFNVITEILVDDVGNPILDGDGNRITVSVTARLVLDVDGQSMGVTTTAAPRRNQTF